jgi:hypothetical protein
MDFETLEINAEYQLYNKQFDCTYNVRCLGNFGVGDKVYLTRLPSKETPETLAFKFTHNILPNAFVCWKSMVNSICILSQIN